VRFGTASLHGGLAKVVGLEPYSLWLFSPDRLSGSRRSDENTEIDLAFIRAISGTCCLSNLASIALRISRTAGSPI
jgi:hypothetical protein